MAQGERFAFLDVVRGLAVLWMIQVHVTNVLLDPALRIDSIAFDLLNISNGYVAPTFIFCAGAGLWIALQRKGTAYLTAGKDLGQYLRRLAYILFWAYALHVPFNSLERMFMATAEEMWPWWKVDVLQTIVYSSLAALAVFFVIRDLRRTTVVYGVIALLVMSGTWWVWLLPPSAVFPRWLAMMISPAPDSPFPLLPWSCYLFAGAFVTGLFMQAQNKARFAKWMFGVGLVGPVVLMLSRMYGVAMPWDELWWRTSPGVHLFRISATLLLMGALFPLEHRLRESSVGKWLQTIGNESLFMYVSHLLLVYGPMADILEAMLGTRTMGYAGVTLVWLVVTGLFVALMMYWHSLKKNNAVLARRLMVIQMIWMAVSLIVTPASFSFSKLLGF